MIFFLKATVISPIESSLIEVNRDVYTAARNAGLSPELAFRQTPEYKIGARLGFTEVENLLEYQNFGVYYVYFDVTKVVT